MNKLQLEIRKTNPVLESLERKGKKKKSEAIIRGT